MLSAMVGVIVMAVATAAMLLAVQLNEQSFANSGRQPLNDMERDLLKDARYGDSDIRRLEEELLVLPFQP
jgi:hypothetical protein